MNYHAKSTCEEMGRYLWLGFVLPSFFTPFYVGLEGFGPGLNCISHNSLPALTYL